MHDRDLEARVAALEAAVEENRRLNQRLADVVDVVTELLVPALDRDDARVRRGAGQPQQDADRARHQRRLRDTRRVEPVETTQPLISTSSIARTTRAPDRHDRPNDTSGRTHDRPNDTSGRTTRAPGRPGFEAFASRPGTSTERARVATSACSPRAAAGR